MSKKKQIIDPIDTSFDNGTNDKSTNNLRYALLSGALPIGEMELQCAVLNDETRVLTATSVFKAFKRSRKGINSRLEIDGTTIPPFLAAKNLKPYINQHVLSRTILIKYQDGGTIKSGYNSELLVDMCEIYLQARRDGVLTESQKKLASEAEILQSAFARVGIAGVIDEATGYQKVRSNDALRVLLSRYIADGLRKWVKTFPDSFFNQLDKLYGNETTTSKNRPKYYGKFINTYIYEPIENGYVKAELDKLNIRDNGSRKAKFHQWLTTDGRDVLIRQIGKVEARAEMFNSIEEFKQAEKTQKIISIAPYLFDDMNKLIS
ncbi:MAG: hypothetical protein [Bacteriophage sp.]|nr:MAG: hypothetical protein [Bacteriophage sp.]